jgi:hypothetical protein
VTWPVVTDKIVGPALDSASFFIFCGATTINRSVCRKGGPAAGGSADAAAGRAAVRLTRWRRAAAAEPEGPADFASKSRESLSDADSDADGETPDPESGGWGGSGLATGVSTWPAARQLTLRPVGAPSSTVPPLPAGDSYARRPQAAPIGCAEEGDCDAGRCPCRFEAVVDEAAAAAMAFWDPFHDDWQHWT